MATTLATVGFVFGYLGFGDSLFNLLPARLYGVVAGYQWMAIPLFVFMGEILVRGGVTERMYKALADWLNPLPGGLLHTNIAASTIFAAISGSSVATAATIGTVAFPTFRQQSYKESWVAGTVASGVRSRCLISSGNA